MAATETFINDMLDDAFTGTFTLGLFRTGLASTTGVEVSGGSYARQTLAFSSANNKRKEISSNAIFSDLPTGQEIVSWAVYKSGTLVDEGMLTASFTADISNNELEMTYSFDLSGT